MKLLLDTHLLLWSTDPTLRLSHTATLLIEDAENDLLFSAVSIWEIAIKHQLRPKQILLDPRVLRRSLLDHGFVELPVTGVHALALHTLPMIHKDPFDRILIAQAQAEGLTLLTSDAGMARYGDPVRRV